MTFIRHSYANDISWYRVIPGVQFKSTPSHGYFVLTSNKLNQMKKQHPELVLPYTCNGNITNYEEDCECNLVSLAFWQQFPREQLKQSILAVAYWYPNMFTQWVARCLETGEIDKVLAQLPADFRLKFREDDTLFDTTPVFTEYVEAVREYCL